MSSIQWAGCLLAVFVGPPLLSGLAAAAEFFESALGVPAQALSSVAWFGHADGGITRPTEGDRGGGEVTSGGFHRLNDLQDGSSLAAAQVER